MPREEKPQRESEPLPDVRDLEMASSDRGKLARLLEERMAWSIQEKEAKEKLEGIKATKKDPGRAVPGLNDKIKELLGAWGVDKCMVGTLRVGVSEIPRLNTDRDKLIQEMTSAGLQPKVVNKIMAACTTTTKSVQLRVTDISKGNGEEGGE